MGGYAGLIELILVFAFVLGWGLLELRSVKRASKKARDAADDHTKVGDDPPAI